MQQRSVWSHHGGTWGILGGARDSHEAPIEAALREADEEAGLDPAQIRVRGSLRDDHGGWSYETVVADVATRPRLWADYESADLSWVPEPQVDQRRLHPGFADTWPALRSRSLDLIVDAANVVGSTPDGWWRDRVGATQRLHDTLTPLPASVRADPDGGWVSLRQVVLVVEGQAARRAVDGSSASASEADGLDPRLVVVAATGSGDDEIVRQARRLSALAAPTGIAPSTGGLAPTAEQTAGTPSTLVVTADRELRRRVAEAGAISVGPRWLHQLVEASVTDRG